MPLLYEDKWYSWEDVIMLVLDVVCPSCNAQVGERCRGRGGREYALTMSDSARFYEVRSQLDA